MRAAARALTGLLLGFCAMPPTAQGASPETQRVYLSGTDKSHTVNWDLFVTKGRQSGQWLTIPVPSQWEQHGFGTYEYGYWNLKPDEQGLYRHRFEVPLAWKGRRVKLVFAGAMTDTEARVNGQLAGPAQQGGFYRFDYDVTSLLDYGKQNLLEATVSKVSANHSVNQAEKKADYWNFGGIYRPVYLEVLPRSHIEHFAVDARADGSFSAEVELQASRPGDRVRARLTRPDGTALGTDLEAVVDAGGKAQLKGRFSKPALWNAEQPRLHGLELRLERGGRLLHRARQRIGFRSVEVRAGDGVYVNGSRVILKGVNRHSHWPETGRALDEEVHRLDIGLIKGMNMNAVRMSHYPPDERFLELCDELGLYVLDELAGWQAAYDSEVGPKLVAQMLRRDVNHPSVLFWCNGNEGGWNRDLDDDYALHDPQKRVVLHPWERFNGFNTKHYPDYAYVAESALHEPDIYMPTEFMHGLYDGGHGAGLDDFWDLMLRHPRFAGGFLWALFDEGTVRSDQAGRIDVAGNAGPDGLLGPHREKEASYATVKELWSPVQVRAPGLGPGFDGRLEIENRYSFNHLRDCAFEWQLLSFSGPRQATPSVKVDATGRFNAPLAPGERGFARLRLPANWTRSGALSVSARDPSGQELFTWSWPIQPPGKASAAPLAGAQAGLPTPQVEDAPKEPLTVRMGGLAYGFDRASGTLSTVAGPGHEFMLSGPTKAMTTLTLKGLQVRQEGGRVLVQPDYGKDAAFSVTWTFSPGQPLRLDYAYSYAGEQDFAGLCFRYPEDQVSGMTWLGQGPQHVWKNRLKGPTFGLWHKAFNDRVTGQDWGDTEFKGYYAGLAWVRVEGPRASFSVSNPGAPVYLQMLTPKAPAHDPKGYCTPAFPEAQISFLSGISAIGTKFQAAAAMGPQSAKNRMLGYDWVTGTLYFDFHQGAIE